MVQPRKPLPPVLRTVAFTVAQGRSLGLGEGRMRGGDLERPFHGIRLVRNGGLGRASAGSSEDSGCGPTVDADLVRRCTALLVALPDGAFFSHLTAARLWPVPLPLRRFAEPVHVSVRTPQYPPRRDGVIGHRLFAEHVAVVRRSDLPVVDPATLFCQLASSLSLPDLVAVGDALVLRPVFQEWSDERPWVGLDHLSDRVDGFRGRGKARALIALGMVRQGAESRPETLLRLAMTDAGLPEPEINVDVTDAAGRFIGRGDLVYRQWKVLVEYDGDQHRVDTRQFDRDVQRLEAFAAAGWTVVRVVGRSFFRERDACIARVRRALVAGGWQPS
jgi:hypothetical protein